MRKTRTKPEQKRIFHIVYYESLLTTRNALLKQSGYAVSSALGNDKVPVLAQQAPFAESLSVADVVALAGHPETWLSALSSMVRPGKGANVDRICA